MSGTDVNWVLSVHSHHSFSTQIYRSLVELELRPLKIGNRIVDQVPLRGSQHSIEFFSASSIEENQSIRSSISNLLLKDFILRISQGDSRVQERGCSKSVHGIEVSCKSLSLSSRCGATGLLAPNWPHVLRMSSSLRNEFKKLEIFDITIYYLLFSFYRVRKIRKLDNESSDVYS